MGFIAIVGSGALGGAVAHALAARDRLTEVRLIDPTGHVARGKALDIQQSAPVEQFSTRLTAAETLESAVGADVIVIADSAAGNIEHTGDAALGLVRHLGRAGSRAPIVCAGAGQRELIGKAVSELGLPRAAVVAWEEATAHGQPLSTEAPPHVMAGLSARIPGLWPHGPYALASAAARVVEAVVRGSRRRFSCFVATESGADRTSVGSMPVELGSRGVVRVIEPALTRQERTALENALEKV
jgi:hypothetical protein